MKFDQKSLLLGFFLGVAALFLLGATTDLPKRTAANPQNRLAPIFTQGATVRYAGALPHEREQPYPVLKNLKSYKVRQVYLDWVLLQDEFPTSPNDSEFWVYVPALAGGWVK